MKTRIVVFGVLALLVQSSYAKTQDKPFYVYKDKGAMVNHYAPSGWMGDYGDLKINDAATDNPKDGRTATKWMYSAKGSQGMNWAGVYYQHPPNNWGERPGGYDLTGYKKFTFWARGERGGEILTDVKIGGLSGENGDTGVGIFEGPVMLTTEWKKYEIDLKDVDLKRIVGGFCWVTNADNNPEGMAFYIDEMRYE